MSSKFTHRVWLNWFVGIAVAGAATELFEHKTPDPRLMSYFCRPAKQRGDYISTFEFQKTADTLKRRMRLKMRSQWQMIDSFDTDTELVTFLHVY